MYVLTKSCISLLIGFIFSSITGYIIIPKLKKLKVSQRISEYVRDIHKNKNGTPTMGGIIFIVPTIIIIILMILLKRINIKYNLIIVLITFILYALIGFLDDYLIIKRNNNKGLTEIQKLLLQVIVAIIFYYLFLKAGNETLIWLKLFNIKIKLGWTYGIFILFLLVATSNAVNITDGLDGLATGLSIIAFFTFGIICWNSGWLDGYQELAIFSFTLVGCLIGFLIYNVNPAKIFMGDTGSLSLGAALATLAILTRYEFLLIIIGIVFILETLRCLIQMIYYKITKKRLFPMTPIHHSFEKKGWIERDIVKLFWIIGLIASMLALILIK